MASISFLPGLSWPTLPEARTIRMIDRDELQRRFDVLRESWLEATGGDLVQVTINLGAIFDELQDLLGGD